MWTIFKGAYRLFALFSVLFVIALTIGLSEGGLKIVKADYGRPAALEEQLKPLLLSMELKAEQYCFKRKLYRASAGHEEEETRLLRALRAEYRRMARVYNDISWDAYTNREKAPTLTQMVKSVC